MAALGLCLRSDKTLDVASREELDIAVNELLDLVVAYRVIENKASTSGKIEDALVTALSSKVKEKTDKGKLVEELKALHGAEIAPLLELFKADLNFNNYDPDMVAEAVYGALADKIQASINKAQEALNHTATATSQNQITNAITEAQTALSATQSIIKKIQITYDSTDRPNADLPQPNAEQIDTSAIISRPLQTTDFTITLPSQQTQKTTATNEEDCAQHTSVEEDCAQHTSVQVVTTPNSYIQLLYKNLTDPNFTCLSLFIPLFLLYLLIKKVMHRSTAARRMR